MLFSVKVVVFTGLKALNPDGMLGHLDHSNPDTFNPQDLEKLIKKVVITK